jgi:DNA-directed RNA polymerase subunit H (RpoH/RPB5)
MHDKLLRVVRKLDSDYEPFGTTPHVDRTDCSCGCRHFVKLAHDIGNDWGVCSNRESPRAGLLTFEHQGCAAFEAFVLDPSLSDTQLRQLIAAASELLKDRRRERSATIEPSTVIPASGEFVYDIRTSYFPRIKGHFPAIFRLEPHEGDFVAIPVESRITGNERPSVIARQTAKNGEVFKIVRENGEFSYQVPFDGQVYNLKQYGDLSNIGFPGLEVLRPFLERVESEAFEKILHDAGARLEHSKRRLEESRDRVNRWRRKQFWVNETPANNRELKEMLRWEEENMEQGPTVIAKEEAFVEWLRGIDRSNPTLALRPAPPPRKRNAFSGR